MAYRPEGFDSDTIVDSCESIFGDSDDDIDAITIESFQNQNGQEEKPSFNHIPPVLQNGDKPRNRRSRNRRKNKKKKQPQAQSTSTDEKVSVEECPSSNEDKLEFSGHPRQQQMFDPKIFIVSGLRDTTAHTALFGYLKSITGGDLEKLTFLGEGRAVAEVGKDISGFQKLKTKMWSRKLEGMRLKIERVRACDSILVSGFPSSVTRETISLYFENVQRSGGGDVSDVSLCKHKDNNYGAVVTFVYPEVIANVVKKRHVLESQKLAVMKYFPQIDAKNINALQSCAVSLQTEETEKEESSAPHHIKPVKRLHTSAEVDDDIMQFIMNGVHFQELEGELDEFYAEIEWSFGSNRVTIWKKADSSYVNKWGIRCKTVVVAFLNRFNKSSLSLEESIQNSVSVALPRLAEMISPEKAFWKQIEEKQELMVISLKEETATVLQSMREFVERIKKEEIRKTYKKETVRNINHGRLLFLKHIGFVEKMKEKYTELEVVLDVEKSELYFEGPRDQLVHAKFKYFQTIGTISEKILNLPSYIADIISTGPGNRYIDELLSQKKISAIFVSEENSAIKIVADTSQECRRAINCLCDSLREAKVQFPSGHEFIFEGEGWKQISENLKSQQLIRLSVSHMTNSIVLQGATYNVEKSEKELKEFIESQRIKERLQIVSNGVARFLKSNLSTEINGIEAQLKNDQVAIEVNVKKLSASVILLRGTASGLDKCQGFISKLRRMVIEKKKDLSSPGLTQLLFSETGQPYLKVIEMKNSVVIEMTRESRKGVKETSQTEVKSLRDELEKEKRKRLSLADDRTRFTTETKTVESAYDLCNFTTNEGLRISWKYGNIANETADILVNSAHSDLSNPTACGKALNIVGGPSFIQACCDQQRSIGKGGVARTSGGNLSCKYVLHAVCCSWDNYQGKAEELLRNLVKEILRKCERRHATSLAMPAIGIGKHMFPEEVAFRIFREEFKIFSSSQTPFTMRDIRIVIFAKQLTTQPTLSQGPTIAETSQSAPLITRFTPLNTGEPKQTVNLHVFSLSNRNIDASLNEVDTFVKNQTTTKEIDHEKVFNVFLEHWSKVQGLARDHDVRITCQRSSVALIEGSVTNVSECKEKLMRLISESVEEERKMNQLKYISKNVRWYYFQGSRAVEYDSELNGSIETASMGNKQFWEISKFGEQYEIDLIHMMEKNKKTGHTERITRKLLGETSSDISLPPNWDPQPQGQVVHLVSLSRSSQEYQTVFSHFKSKGGSGSRVSNIQRIQNRRLYMAFLAAKMSMNGADNEMQLFHGTSASNTESINANNFNRSFAGVHGVTYGDGVYFARDSSYSLRYSRLHGNSSNSKMYVARVLVGRYTIGGKGMKAPPSRNDPGNPGVRYDSVVDNVQNPSIFVIFVDNHCYPEYLITFAGTSLYM